MRTIEDWWTWRLVRLWICAAALINLPQNWWPKKQVKEAINSLNRGKAADIYGLTAEHFLFGGEGLVEPTTDIITDCSSGRLSDALKVGVLTPVYTKKGSAVEAKNYRGIIILPIITKVLEAELRKKIQPLIEANQNSLQRGFTQNSSPMNGMVFSSLRKWFVSIRISDFHST